MSNFFKYPSILRLFISSVILLILSGCFFEPCIEADDFGFPKRTLSPKSPIKDEWIDTGFMASGKRITTEVLQIQLYQKPEEKLPEKLQFQPVNFTNSTPTSAETPVVEEASSSSSLLSRVNAALKSLVTMVTPSALTSKEPLTSTLIPPQVDIVVEDPTYHLAIEEQLKNKRVTPIKLNYVTDKFGHNVMTAGYNEIPPPDVVSGGRVWIKVKYDSKNDEDYQVIFKSGVQKADREIFAGIYDLVDRLLNNAAKSTYETLVDPKKTEFVSYTRYFLTIYIILLSISFIFGIVTITQKDLMTSLLKITIIVTLISPQSFDFFNNYLFVMFQEGVSEIIVMMSPDKYKVLGLQTLAEKKILVFDALLYEYISPETFKKLLSLMASLTFTGFILCVVLFIIICSYVYYLIKAFLILLIVKITVGMLIILAPICFVASLFKFTKPLFDNWLNYMIRCALQPVFLIAGILLVNHLIQGQFQKMLGFKVCPLAIERFGKYPDPEAAIYYYSPVFDHTKLPQEIKVPFKFTRSEDALNNSGAGTLCEAYECTDGKRYPDLPFLKLASDDFKNDQVRIDHILEGEFVTMGEVFLFLVLIYLFVEFTVIIVALSKTLANDLSPVSARFEQAVYGAEARINQYGVWTGSVSGGAAGALENLVTNNSLVKYAIKEYIHKPLQGMINDPLNKDQDQTTSDILGVLLEEKIVAPLVEYTASFREVVGSVEQSIKDDFNKLPHIAKKAVDLALAPAMFGKHMYDIKKMYHPRTEESLYPKDKEKSGPRQNIEAATLPLRVGLELYKAANPFTPNLAKMGNDAIDVVGNSTIVKSLAVVTDRVVPFVGNRVADLDALLQDPVSAAIVLSEKYKRTHDLAQEEKRIEKDELKHENKLRHLREESKLPKRKKDIRPRRKRRGGVGGEGEED
jgi:type IV secretory pathway VirB6-like protein